MVGVVKVDGLSELDTADEIQKFFTKLGAQPVDIHFIKQENDIHTSALLIFNERRAQEMSLQGDGIIFKSNTISVKKSSTKEFNVFFPGHAIIRSEAEIVIVKLENLSKHTSVSQIRTHLKEEGGARALNIRIVYVKGSGAPEGSAFLIFDSKVEAQKSLRVNGTQLNGNPITLTMSDHAAFSCYFSEPVTYRPPPKINFRSKPDFQPDFNSTTKQEVISSAVHGILKVEGLNQNLKVGEIKAFFVEQGAKPDDIHIVKGPNGLHNGTMFLMFKENRQLELALQLDGVSIRGNTISVETSSQKELHDVLANSSLKLDQSASSNSGVSYNRLRDRSRSPPRISHPKGNFDSMHPHNKNRFSGRGDSEMPRSQQENVRFPTTGTRMDQIIDNDPESIEAQIRRITNLASTSGGTQMQDILKVLANTVSSVLANKNEQIPPKNNTNNMIPERDFPRSNTEFNRIPGSDGQRRNTNFNMMPERDGPRGNMDSRIPGRDGPRGLMDFHMPGRDGPRGNMDSRMPGRDSPRGNTDSHMPKRDGPGPRGNMDSCMPGRDGPRGNMDSRMPGRDGPRGNMDFHMPRRDGPRGNIGFHIPGRVGPRGNMDFNMMPQRNGPRGNMNFNMGPRRDVPRRMPFNQNIPPRNLGPKDVPERMPFNQNIPPRNLGPKPANSHCVVGLRNLPFSITPDEILDHFTAHGFPAIPGSVRIHLYEDGRASGDAVVTFPTFEIARDAVLIMRKIKLNFRKIDCFTYD